MEYDQAAADYIHELEVDIFDLKEQVEGLKRMVLERDAKLAKLAEQGRLISVLEERLGETFVH
jgi:hypothetical protein